MADQNEATEGKTGVIIVPDEIADAVRAYAAKLAEEQSSEVEGFAMGMPDLGSMGSLLGRPNATIAGGINMLSGTGCKSTGPRFSPNDFDCEDDD